MNLGMTLTVSESLKLTFIFLFYFIFFLFGLDDFHYSVFSRSYICFSIISNLQ